ncbi:MAG: hypothetical protein LBO71_08345 [Prevotellaceae bacterium]|jgi:hypothetical protein|nr:hypothetical protein [Prevotellaceae bacterium]
MEKILFAIFIIWPFIFSSCVENEDPHPTEIITIPETQFGQLIKEYNINKDGLVVESVVNGIDTALLVFNGRIGAKLWVGYYKKEDKSQILDWTETTKLDTIVNFYKGYGEYDNLKVEKFALGFPYKFKNSFCFLLFGRESEMISYKASSDLYFINSNSLIKKLKTISTQRYHYQQIIPWYDGIVAKLGNENFVCYTMSGDSLFTFKNGIGIKAYSAINYEECIDFGLNSSDFHKYFFRRINLQSNETIWTNDNQPLKDLPNNARLDKINIQKNDNIWVYEVNYTQFDGTKQVVKISLNINNGVFETL